MTRKEKCEVCRVRKIKCDERKPTCGPCSTKGRACVYNENISLHDEGFPGAQSSLIVQSARDAPFGQGRFHTLASQRLPASNVSVAEISPSVSNSHTALSSRWVYMLGPIPTVTHPFEILGTWATWVPSRLNSSELLALAATYVVDRHYAFKNRTAANIRKAEISAISATRTLRSRLEAESFEYDGDVLLTVHLLFMAEVLGGIGNLNYFAHVQALSKMLKIRWKQGKFEVLDDAIVRSFFLEDITGAIFVGDAPALQQALETNPAYFRPGPHTSEYDRALKSVMQRIAVVPNLLHMVKQWSKQPGNHAVQEQAIALARRLYDFQEVVHVEQMISKFSVMVKTKTPPLAPPVVQSLQFDSLQIFWLALSFFTYQALVYGIILQILGLPNGGAMNLDHPLIAREALSVTVSIAKCTQYASEFDSTLPIVEMRMIKPMIISWGVCDLVEQSISVNDDDYNHVDFLDQAASMKKYFLHALKYINTRWHGKPSEMSEALLRRYRVAVLEGTRYSNTTPWVQAEFEW